MKQSLLTVERFWEYGARSFDDLDKDEKEILTAEIIRERNRRDQLDFIIETPVADDLTSHLICALGNETSKEILLETILNGAIQYAKPEIERLFHQYASYRVTADAEPRYDGE